MHFGSLPLTMTQRFLEITALLLEKVENNAYNDKGVSQWKINPFSQIDSEAYLSMTFLSVSFTLTPFFFHSHVGITASTSFPETWVLVQIRSQVFL